MSSKCIKLTAKKYKERPGPPYSAQDCKGRRMKGNDGRMYVSQEAANGVYRFVAVGTETRKALKPKGKRYAILDNGSEPFVVFVRPGHLEVYHNDFNRETEAYTLGKKILAIGYLKVHIGDNDLKIPGPGPAPKGMYPGNSILVQTGSNKYIYIGSEIYSFSALDGDTIRKYYSPVGNNAVPYPYAIGEKYAYMMLDHAAIDISAINPKEDVYPQYYAGGLDKTQKKLKIKMIARRKE